MADVESIVHAQLRALSGTCIEELFSKLVHANKPAGSLKGLDYVKM